MLCQINPTTCSECENACCRNPFKQFYSQESIDRMELSKEEIKKYFQKLTILDEGNKTHSFYITRKKKDGSCVFLNQEGLCQIYDERSLDCGIYPFFFEINLDENELTLYLDLTVPCHEKYKELIEDDIYIQDLMERIRKDTANWTESEIIGYNNLEPKTDSKDEEIFKRILVEPFYFSRVSRV